MPLTDPMLVVQVVGSAFSLLAGIAAWLSAAAAKRAAVATERATQAQLLNSLLDAYSSSEMLSSMMTLRAWGTKHGKHAADEFRRLRQEDYPSIQDVDFARRRVSHFFQKIYALHAAGHLDEPSVRLAAPRGQVDFFREIIEPLEAAISVNYDRSSFDGLGSMYGIGPSLPAMANPSLQRAG